MNILVTGGTGFVGSHLIDALLAGGRDQVTALVRDSGRLKACGFRDRVSVLQGDLFSAESFPADIELVFHLAAVTKALSAAEFTRINCEGTRSLLEKLKPLPRLKKVVLLSSLAAAGPNRQAAPLREESPSEPISLYGKSKLAQEKLLAAECPAPFVVLRAPIVFGPGDMDMLDAFRILRRGILPVLGRTERRYSIIYVKDLVRGMIAAAASPCGNEMFYVANPEAVEWRVFMGQAARLLGRSRMRTVVVPELLGRVLAELSEARIRLLGRKAIFNRDKFSEMKFPAWVCSAEKIESQLHFQPRIPLPAALKETIDWYRQRGLL
jgi:nucleoside-diphosphate-sugar epimerase